MRSIFRDDEGFTVLEAAITLIAFVIVASVFSYVVLNMGFFTTQKSQELTKRGIVKAASSLVMVGNIIAYQNDNTTMDIEILTIYVQSTAGGEPIDLSKNSISYTSTTWHSENVTAVLSWIHRGRYRQPA